MTTYDIAVERGWRAFKSGASLFDNPFDKIDDWFLHQAWEEGFLGHI